MTAGNDSYVPVAIFRGRGRSKLRKPMRPSLAYLSDDKLGLTVPAGSLIAGLFTKITS